jgi:hypothetical protein
MTLRLDFKDGSVTENTEMFVKMKNYVYVTVFNDQKYTGAEGKTNPVEGSARTQSAENRILFNQSVSVPVSSNESRLLVRIMDKDMFQDDICSEGYVNIGPCGLLSGQPTNYRLFMQLPLKGG